MRKYLVKISNIIALMAGVSVVLLSCESDRKESKLFQLMEADQTGVEFSNEIVQTDTFSIIDYMYFFNGGGVGVGDINNDGLPDLYFTGNLVSSKLYLNKGNFQFEDITAKAGVATKGWCTGVAFADVDADGFVDIYVSRAGSTKGAARTNLLFLNNHDNTFTEIGKTAGVADTSYTTQSAFFDYDRDGDLDLYVLNHDHAPQSMNNPVPIKTNGKAKNTDKLYRNVGNDAKGRPRFEDVSHEANILTEGFGLGVAIHDINDDGWPDVYVANDFVSPDILYINNKNGTFTNRASEFLKHQSYNGMGVDIADYNNDGLQDIIVMDMLPEDNLRQKMMLGGMTNEKFDFLLSMNYPAQYMRNTLQLNRGNNMFSEIGQLAGVDRTDWSWSPLFADFDNDGWKDLFITNGYLKDITDRDFIMFTRNKAMFKKPEEVNKILISLMEKQPGVKLPNAVFRNNTDLTFSRKNDWGIDQPSFSNGAAYADIDNDGDLDMIVNNINEKAFLYRNDTKHDDAGHYLQIVLQGEGANRMALGAKVTLYAGGKKQFYEHSVYRGYQSTVDNVIHFGIGSVNVVDSLGIVWPDGKRSTLNKINPNQRIKVQQSDAKRVEERAMTVHSTLFNNLTKTSGVDFVHTEDPYSDLTAHPLLPRSYAGAGPSLASGDVDGNGLDDFYIGGSASSPGRFMVQIAPGKFKLSEFSQPSSYDEAGVLLFDADNDNDLDLYIAAGITEVAGKPALHRLFRNDGKGNFTNDADAVPGLGAGSSVVTASDFDGDGDLDLFIGGRVDANNYPAGPGSHVLRNNNGKFSDVTSEVCSELKTAGMVSTAIWTDFDNDGHLDLIVAGEWMSVVFYRNVNGRLVNFTASTGLSGMTGWWNSISGGDIDNDGDTDYILGNLGYNIPFRDGDKESVSLFYGDLDGTSTDHAMLSWQYQGIDYPWTPKDILYKLMPRYSKRFLQYNAYARASMDDLLKPVPKEKVKILRADNLATGILQNLGNGKFAFKALPLEAQIAPVNGIIADDFDSDGNVDLLLTGNQYDADISMGRFDAFAGLYLKGNGKGDFFPVELAQSGFVVATDGRAMIKLNGGLIISTANKDSVRVFHYQEKRVQIKIRQLDISAIVTGKSPGARRKVEFYYGAGYLSQSSRSLEINPAAEIAEITDSRGKRRKNIH